MTKNVIAVDVGYGNTKAVWGHCIDTLGKECWAEVCFRSVAPLMMVDEEKSGGTHNPDRIALQVNGKKYYAGPAASWGVEARALDPHYIDTDEEKSGATPNPDRIALQVNGKKYYAGPAASWGVEARALDPHYIDTDEHEALLRASIHIAMREKRELFEEIDMLVVGLPVSGFRSRGRRLQELASLAREVPVPSVLQVAGEPRTVTVRAKQVKVIPQPFGGLRYAAEYLPQDDELFSGKALSMVIDPGYHTFDWFVSNGMQPEMKLSGSFDGGVSGLLRLLSQAIGYDHGTGSLEFDQVEEGMLRGSINLGYQVIDTRPYRAILEEAARKEVMAFLGRIDANKARLSRVFLTGGGAPFYHRALVEKLPGYQIHTLQNSVMGNARGYWLSGCDEFDG